MELDATTANVPSTIRNAENAFPPPFLLIRLIELLNNMINKIEQLPRMNLYGTLPQEQNTLSVDIAHVRAHAQSLGPYSHMACIGHQSYHKLLLSGTVAMFGHGYY